MAVQARDRIRARANGEFTTVRILLAHPMHTGRGMDDNEQVVPAEYIQDIRCWRNKQEMLAIKCGTATARNPYFAFQLKGGEPGDIITVRWVDNLGAKGTVETTVT